VCSIEIAHLDENKFFSGWQKRTDAYFIEPRIWYSFNECASGKVVERFARLCDIKKSVRLRILLMKITQDNL